MKCYIGIDIGAISITSAVMVDDAGGLSLPGGQFVSGGDSRGADLWLSEYRRTRGRPVESATDILEQVIASAGIENVAGVCLTGSAASLVAEKLAAPTVNEFKAIALGLSVLGVQVRTVFEMGGQTSKYLLLSRGQEGYSISDYATNGDCAAGTGAFIDQQAGRLNFAVEDVGRIALESERTAQIAGRCSVFAKSDMIHAQQKGYTPGEVLSGLCRAVARNFRMAVVRSHPVEPPVAFIGGLAANVAVDRAMREIFDLEEGDFIVPDAYAHAPAIGAARAARQQEPKADWNLAVQMEQIRSASDAAGRLFPTAEPLSTHRLVLLRDQVEPATLSYGDEGTPNPDVSGFGDPEKTDAYLGIDIGSVSTNLVVIDSSGAVIKEIYTRTQGRPIEVVSAGLAEISGQIADRVVIRGVGTTGSGRELIGQLVGADTINDEITAHKTGATFIGQTMLNGRVPDTIFEIGGQDSKFISLQDGVVVDFTMNDACAAGTGSFLEERAEELDISIIDEFAALALTSDAPIRLGERCTVFMERDVADYMQRGAEKADLVAGLAYSVVYNYINRVVRGRHIGESIFFQGGTAYNDAVAAAMSEVLDKEIVVPPHNGVIGAIGAALLARDKMTMAVGEEASEQAGQYVPVRAESKNTSVSTTSRFRGYDMSKVDYALREFTCKGCSNHCIVQEFTVEGEKTYWGDKCSDRYRKRSKSTTKPVIDDLFALRERMLDDESDLPDVPSGALKVGVPLAMFAMDFLPFWRAFWRHCGFEVVVSEPTNRNIAAAGMSAVVAEPCFPVIVAHGHIAELLETGVDYIFLPNTVSTETKWMRTESHLCPWGQTLPFVIRRAPAFEKYYEKFLSPCVRFREGPKAVGKIMRQLCGSLGVKPKTVASALAEAYETQKRFRRRLVEAGRKALATIEKTGKPGIVIIGRPYNVHDAGVNLNVAKKLRDYYGVNCIPIDCLETDDVDITDVNENMYWEYGRRLIAAAKIVGERDNLHIIHITNFKCGPDSFIRHFIRTASGKPFLSLQFDGHSNDAGMMTRCEAYLDSKGILRPWRKRPAQEDATFAGVTE
ncbi:MAG: acyl-CoA dehydratase activase [Planctomycetota bacterium]|nr:acyl-CoA dehydratase activase [Planctomycetota bacterium]